MPSVLRLPRQPTAGYGLAALTENRLKSAPRPRRVPLAREAGVVLALAGGRAGTALGAQ